MADGIERFEIRWRQNETWKGAFIPSDLSSADFDRIPGLTGPPIVEGMGEFDLTSAVFTPGGFLVPPAGAVRLSVRIKTATGGTMPASEVRPVWVDELGTPHTASIYIGPAEAEGKEWDLDAWTTGHLISSVGTSFLIGAPRPGVIAYHGGTKWAEDFEGTWSAL